MVDEAEICKFFRELGLTNEEDRTKMLSQGLPVQSKEENRNPLRIESDNVTTADY